MVEGARLESAYTPKGYRGFESLSLRHCLVIGAADGLLDRAAYEARFGERTGQEDHVRNGHDQVM